MNMRSNLPDPQFPGIVKPGTNFDPIRDQRRALPNYVDVDLSTARSMAAGTALILPLAGNVFFIDQDTINTGIATVYFQDTTARSTPITVGAGSIFRIPFTGLAVENTAQAGKRLRIIYGVDLDFLPALNANVAISGTVQTYYQPASFWDDTTPLGINGSIFVYASGSNTNGAIIHCFESVATSAAVSATMGSSLVLKAGTPTSLADGNMIAAGHGVIELTAPTYSICRLAREIRVPPGQSLWFVNGPAAEGTAWRHCEYTLL